jgi:hypothetical protein
LDADEIIVAGEAEPGSVKLLAHVVEHGGPTDGLIIEYCQRYAKRVGSGIERRLLGRPDLRR